jgi:ABC-type multidrug transport system ATPase subunit
MTLQTIRHGAVRRGHHLVLEAGEFNVPESAVVGLVGINGAGKTSLMMSLAGLLPVPRGRRSRTSQDGARRIGYAPQRATFPEWLRAPDIARMFGFAFDDLERACPGMRLDEIRPLQGGAMSVGQAQTLSIALALAGNAPIILLDEPFAPLDFRRRIALIALLSRPADARGLVLVSSQSAADLLDICNWIVVLKAGRYVYDGPLSEMIGEVSGDRKQRLEERILSYIA